jgi:hypothetical protein
MTPRTSLRQALTDENLLGAALAGPSWATWRAVLIGAMGEALEPAEAEAFVRVTGRQPLTQRVDELWCCVGRRGGKSRAMSSLAVYLAGLCDYRDTLDHGEVGTVLLLAPDVRQSKLLLDYAEAMLSATPIMSQLLSGRTAEILTLTNGIRLEVRSASFRRIRGMTCVAVLADELAFWRSDESANPDTEILNAARPALATTQGPLICISSPYARRGALWDTYRRHYGPEGDAVILVAHGTSRTFNPELPQAVVDRAMERDEPAARAEYLAEFRTDVENFLTREVIEACVKVGVHERAPDRKHVYTAFADPSGGSSDSFTLAVVHTEGTTQILDAIRERKPPFSPEAVVAEYAALLRQYRCSTVYGDRYAGEWPPEQFRKHGVNYEASEQTKSEIYVDLLPLLNSGAVDLLDNDRLVHQLAGLERRTSRSGRDSIDHGPGGHDDVSNCVAGALVTAFKSPGGFSAEQRAKDTLKILEAGRRLARTVV